MEKKINVLHINCNYLTTALHQIMIQHLNKNNINNIVFAPTYNLSNAIIEPDEYVVVSKCFRKIDRIFYFYKQKKILKSIESNIHNISSFDCTHAYTLFTDGNIAYYLFKKYNIPYVVAVRDTDVNAFLKYKKYLKPLARNILKNATYIFFLSNTYKTALINLIYDNKTYPFENKTKIIPNGINDFWLNNINYNKEYINNKKDINIVYAGKINKRKNIIITQKALQSLREEGFNINFTIAGEIEDKNVYKSIINFDNTNYIGKKNMQELLELYRKNDIFVMPSHTETFGLVYVEAMTQGLPVIYTKGQGFDGQFNEGCVGFHVSDTDYISVADGIKKILNNYKDISQNAMRYCVLFDWEKITEKYAELYKEIIKENTN